VGGPFDAVVDLVGGPLLPALLDRVRDGGRWVVAGALGGAVVDLDLRRLYLHNVALVGSSMHTPAHFDRLVAEAVAGRVRPRVAARHDLSALHEAQEEFGRSAHVGKIVVTP
jgi:NADPH:quinone reductase-like Zn-dependent oxidoreductase